MSTPPPPAPLNRTALLTLTALFTLLAVVYGLATPRFETPDEPLHFYYAHHLAQGRGLPVLPPRPDDGWGQEGAQPPLAYALLAAPALLAPPDAGPAALLPNPYAVAGLLAAPDNVNWFVHSTGSEGFPGDALTAAVRAGRLLSALAGAAAVLGAAQLARWTLRDERLALAAAAIMAFTPQFLFLSGAVTNDVLTVALSSWVLALAAEALHSGLSRRKLLALGILCGLAPLAKVSGGLAAAVALAALLAPHAGLPLTVRVRHVLLVGGVALALCGWWPLRNLLLYGAPLALSEHLAVIGHRLAPPTLIEFVNGGELAALFMSYWGLFGWQSVPLPPFAYLALAALCGSAGAGLAVLAAQRVTGVFRSPAAAALLLGMAALTASAVWSWNTQVYAAQGRLLFPALAPLGILLAAGLAALVPQGWRARAVSGAALSLFALSAAAPLLVIAPRYAAPPSLPVAPDAPALVRYGSDLVLQSAEIIPAGAAPGERVTARLVWRTERPLPENYAIGVQLVTPDWRPLAQRDSFPGGGLTATSLWTPGVAIEDRHPLWVSAAAEQPQQAQLAVAVYDRRTGVPLPAVDAAGRAAGPAVPVAHLRVPPPAAPASSDAQVLGRFPALGVAVERVDLRPSSSASASALDVALAWRAEADGVRGRPLRVSLQLFGNDGSMQAQHDGEPLGGRFPMTAWRQGDVLDDRHRLSLPLGAPQGVYRLRLIVYDAETGQRAAVSAASGAPPADALDLGEVRLDGVAPPSPKRG